MSLYGYERAAREREGRDAYIHYDWAARHSAERERFDNRDRSEAFMSGWDLEEQREEERRKEQERQESRERQRQQEIEWRRQREEQEAEEAEEAEEEEEQDQPPAPKAVE